MSNRTLKEWIQSQDDGGRVFAQEQLIAATTEELWAHMEDKHVSKAQLAENLSCSKAYVSQVLSGSRNMTLRTLADFAHALDCTVHVYVCDRHVWRDWKPLQETAWPVQRLSSESATVVDISDGARQSPDRPAVAA